MSSNSQLLNIINDIEELNEQTTTINSDIETINGDITDLGTNKQNKIQVTDTIQISKLKTQYITMSLTGQDLQSKLTSLGNDISSNADDIDGLKLLTSTHTSDISSNADDIDGLKLLTSTHTSDISSNADDIDALQLLTSTHTSDINSKQDKLLAGTNINIDETTNTISSVGGSDITLDENTDITTGTISSSDITGRFGTTIKAPNIHATGNLLINKNTTNDETINVLTDKQDTIYATTDIVPRQIVFSTIIGRTNATITSDNIKAKSSLSFLKNNQYLDVSSQLDTKQDILIAGNNITIDQTTNTISAVNEVSQDDLTIGLDTKQNKLEAGNGITINDASNIISATGVTQDELTTGLETKQNSIGIYDNFIINSMYVAPFTSKTLTNPSVNGELRASILTVEDNTLGLINIGDSISTITTGLENKQDEINTTSNLTLGTLDASGLITCGELTVGGKTIVNLVDEASGSGLTQSDIDAKQDKLEAGSNISIDETTNIISSTFTINENTNLTTASIICDDITSRVGHTITGDTIQARTNLLIGTGTVSTINVLDELNKKQDELQAGENITIDENNIISATGGIATTLGYASHLYEEFGIFTSAITSLTHTFENTFNVNGGTLIFTFETTALKTSNGTSTITYQILTPNNEIRHVCNHPFTFVQTNHRYLSSKIMRSS